MKDSSHRRPEGDEEKNYEKKYNSLIASFRQNNEINLSIMLFELNGSVSAMVAVGTGRIGFHRIKGTQRH